MKISEVVETPEGTITYKTELSPAQVEAMVKWFVTKLVSNGAVRMIEEASVTKGPETLQ